MAAGLDTAAAHAAPQVTWLQSVRWRRRAGHALLHGVLIALGFTFLAPLLWVLSTSLKAPGQVFNVPVEWLPDPPFWSNYREIFEILPLTSYLRSSAVVTVLGTMGSVVSSLLVGYSLARLRWPGREIVFTVLLATMMLPGIVTLVPAFILFKYLGWLDTWYPLWVPSWFGTAFYIFLTRQFMLGLPYELEEAARVDGANSLRILLQVITPLCGPAVTTVAIFSFLHHYNDLMWPLIILSDNNKWTVPLGLLFYQGRFGNFWHLVMAASTVAILPVVILFFVAQKRFIQGIQFTGLAGR
ncbi:MAG TPA: carbohydrate ABC transporter permease [Chloroflexota bacterium]|jgi:ABC-type glycerol-3-phosphate transport system permease component|nr:carbohydrate ABC transporter permease [Chloroflexota bacterium]